jgi:hypothetical protein
MDTHSHTAPSKPSARTAQGPVPQPTSGRENSKLMYFFIGAAVLALLLVLSFNALGPEGASRTGIGDGPAGDRWCSEQRRGTPGRRRRHHDHHSCTAGRRHADPAGTRERRRTRGGVALSRARRGARRQRRRDHGGRHASRRSPIGRIGHPRRSAGFELGPSSAARCATTPTALHLGRWRHAVALREDEKSR